MWLDCFYFYSMPCFIFKCLILGNWPDFLRGFSQVTSCPLWTRRSGVSSEADAPLALTMTVGGGREALFGAELRFCTLQVVLWELKRTGINVPGKQKIKKLNKIKQRLPTSLWSPVESFRIESKSSLESPKKRLKCDLSMMYDEYE